MTAPAIPGTILNKSQVKELATVGDDKTKDYALRLLRDWPESCIEATWRPDRTTHIYIGAGWIITRKEKQNA